MALLLLFFSGLEAQTIPDKAICPVCAVLEAPREPEPEKVKGWKEYEGQHYYFCSAECLEKFDEDPRGFIPPVFPYPAPHIAARGLDNQEVTLKDYAGKVVLLDFWATWCKPCEKLMPDLHRLSAQYGEKGLVVIGLSIDEGKDAAQKVQKFIEKKNIGYPVLLDVFEEPAWSAFHVKAIPAMFLIDRKGAVVGRWLGGFEHQDVEAEILRLLDQ